MRLISAMPRYSGPWPSCRSAVATKAIAPPARAAKSRTANNPPAQNNPPPAAPNNPPAQEAPPAGADKVEPPAIGGGPAEPELKTTPAGAVASIALYSVRPSGALQQHRAEREV